MGDEFYSNWGTDYMAGYEMTEEEWNELHTPYDEKEDWHLEDE